MPPFARWSGTRARIIQALLLPSNSIQPFSHCITKGIANSKCLSSTPSSSPLITHKWMQINLCQFLCLSFLQLPIYFNCKYTTFIVFCTIERKCCVPINQSWLVGAEESSINTGAICVTKCVFDAINWSPNNKHNCFCRCRIHFQYQNKWQMSAQHKIYLI